MPIRLPCLCLLLLACCSCDDPKPSPRLYTQEEVEAIRREEVRKQAAERSRLTRSVHIWRILTAGAAAGAVAMLVVGAAVGSGARHAKP